METLSQLLGGMGMLGILAAIVLGFLMLLVLPWLSLVECVRSNRSSNAKAVLIVGLVLTWGIGSLFYGLFITRSRALKFVTVCGVVLFLVVAVPSAISFGTGLKMHSRLAQEQATERIRQVKADFQPAVLAPGALEPFSAIHFMHGSHQPRAATLAVFTEDGPLADGARDVDLDVRQVAHDAANDRFFALTSRDFGTITPSSGRFTKIAVDPSLGDFSYPAGIAVDTRRQKVIVATSHVFLRFFVYDPNSSDWERLPAELRGLSIVGLAYDSGSDTLYAFEKAASDDFALQRMHRFNTSGASLGAIPLNPPIPISTGRRDLLQLQFSSGKVVLLLPPSEDGYNNRLFAIDPAQGLVLATEALIAEESGVEPTQCEPVADDCVSM